MRNILLFACRSNFSTRKLTSQHLASLPKNKIIFKLLTQEFVNMIMMINYNMLFKKDTTFNLYF